MRKRRKRGERGREKEREKSGGEKTASECSLSIFATHTTPKPKTPLFPRSLLSHSFQKKNAIRCCSSWAPGCPAGAPRCCTDGAADGARKRSVLGHGHGRRRRRRHPPLPSRRLSCPSSSRRRRRCPPARPRARQLAHARRVERAHEGPYLCPVSDFAFCFFGWMAAISMGTTQQQQAGVLLCSLYDTGFLPSLSSHFALRCCSWKDASRSSTQNRN